MKDPEKLQELFGETISLTTPSGYKVVLRQQTGDDDDIISNASLSQDGTSINKFVASIVVDTDFNVTGRLSLEDILKMKLCDKYFILLSSRIFSLGQFLNFTYEWPTTPEHPVSLGPVEYTEDLSRYIWEYGIKPFPLNPSDPDYFKHRIKPHRSGKATEKEIVTSSGKKLRYTFMNGEGERYLLKLPPELESKNQELFARNLQLWLNDKWVKVENFKNFNPTDMAEIRKDIREEDPVNELTTELENPTTHEKIPYLIVGTQDFFFPREI